MLLIIASPENATSLKSSEGGPAKPRLLRNTRKT